MLDELFKCSDCGAVFESNKIILGYEEEKDSCPNCGSWGIFYYKEEEDEH